MRTTVLGIVFGVAAFLSGIRALGYWAILRFGALPSAQKREIALVVATSILLFLLFAAVPAYLQERTHGARSVAAKALYLTGMYGLPPVGLFAIASRGEVLRMPEVALLFLFFVCLIARFRPAHFYRPGLAHR